MPDLKALSARVSSSFNDAQKAADSASYQRLAAVLSESGEQLREHIQDITGEQISKIIRKLEAGSQIAKDELAFVRLWVVGDAQYYLKLENNFQDWLSELGRIMNEVDRINNPEPDLETASRLRALLEDGKRVVYDIAFYLEKKERIANFEESTLELDKQEKDLLVKLLRAKSASKEF